MSQVGRSHGRMGDGLPTARIWCIHICRSQVRRYETCKHGRTQPLADLTFPVVSIESASRVGARRFHVPHFLAVHGVD